MATIDLTMELEAFDMFYTKILDKTKLVENSLSSTDLSTYLLGATTSLLQNIPNIVTTNQQRSKQTDLLGEQIISLKHDSFIKLANSSKDTAIKEAQKAQIESDTSYNIDKKTVMVKARLDNLRIQAADKFSGFMQYISAGGGVPDGYDFFNMRKLISGIVSETNTDITKKSDGTDNTSAGVTKL